MRIARPPIKQPVITGLPQAWHDQGPHRPVRLLVVDDRKPDPMMGYGFPRMNAILNVMPECGFHRDFLSLSNCVGWRESRGARDHPGYADTDGPVAFSEFWERRHGEYDAVWISRTRNLRFVLPCLRRYRNCVLIADVEAMDAERRVLTHLYRGKPLDEPDIKALFDAELDLIREADIVVAVCERDRQLLASRNIPNVFVVGHGHQVDIGARAFEQRHDVLYVGSFITARDNGDSHAVRYLARHLQPQVTANLGCNVSVVGRASRPGLLPRNARPDGFTFIDSPIRLDPFYHSHRVGVVPTLIGAGLPWKATEALSYGLPSVVTPLVADQLGISARDDIALIGDNPESFTAHAVRLYRDRELWSKLRENALHFAAERLSMESIRRPLRSMAEAIIKTRPVIKYRGGD